MTTFAWPSFLVVRDARMEPESAVLGHGGDLGDSTQMVDLLKDRWTAEINLVPFFANQTAQARQAAAFFARLRGGVNTIAVPNHAQPIPRGTLRGSPTAQATAQGADTIVINCTGSETLEAYDCIGIGSQLLMVAEQCVAVAGVLTVPLANRVRSAITGGTAVVWNRPTVTMRVMSGASVLFDPRMAQAGSLQLVEAITA